MSVEIVRFTEPCDIEDAQARIADLTEARGLIKAQLKDPTRRDLYASAWAYNRWRSRATMARHRAYRELEYLQQWLREEKRKLAKAEVEERAKQEAERARLRQELQETRRANRAQARQDQRAAQERRRQRQEAHRQRMAAAAMTAEIADPNDPVCLLQAALVLMRTGLFRQPYTPTERDQAVISVVQDYLERKAAEAHAVE